MLRLPAHSPSSRIFRYLIVILFASILALIVAETAARIRISLRRGDTRFLWYNEKLVFAPIGQQETQPLLKPQSFAVQKRMSGEEGQNAIFYGSSVMGSMEEFLKKTLHEKGIAVNRDFYSYQNALPVIRFDQRSIILLESLVIPFSYYFFHENSAARRLFGKNLYHNLYHNSVLFLTLSERDLDSKINFSSNMIEQFIKETLSIFEKSFQNIQSSKAPVLYVIFPHNHLKTGSLFSQHLGGAIDHLLKEIEPVLAKYDIKTSNVFKNHAGEFTGGDFRDNHHFNDRGAEKVSRYVMADIRKYFPKSLHP